MAKTNLFHVQETILLANGFTKEVIDDKNGQYDEINTIRFEYFTNRISRNVKLEVNYTYKTEDEKQYKLYQSGVELHVGDEWCSIPINNLRDLLALILILKGNE